jgi:hypothetical protein
MLIEFKNEEYFLDNMPSFEIQDLLDSIMAETETCHRNDRNRLNRYIRDIEAYQYKMTTTHDY